ncbi:MAG: hypothetical protein J5I93_25935 [Pirellulaceae bacterium]|nr:hypothetical protein [Pirellulaceae bacterium]
MKGNIMADAIVPTPSEHGDRADDRAQQTATRLIALIGRLSSTWTTIDTAQADRLDGVALYLLCGAGLLELQFSGRAWTDESALDFEATACGVWIDAERKSILPEELRHAVPAWATSAVAVQLSSVVEARLTSHGEHIKHELSSCGVDLLLDFVCATPIRGRVTVRLVGNQGPAPGAVKRDDVGGGILAALQGIEASQRVIAGAVDGGDAAAQPSEPSAELFHDVTLAAKVVVGGKRTAGLSRLVEIAKSKEPAGRKLHLMEKTGLIRPDVSAAELAALLKVTPAAVKKTRWWKTRMAQRRSATAEANAPYKDRRRPGQRGRRR